MDFSTLGWPCCIIEMVTFVLDSCHILSLISTRLRQIGESDATRHKAPDYMWLQICGVLLIHVYGSWYISFIILSDELRKSFLRVLQPPLLTGEVRAADKLGPVWQSQHTMSFKENSSYEFEKTCWRKKKQLLVHRANTDLFFLQSFSFSRRWEKQFCRDSASCSELIKEGVCG